MSKSSWSPLASIGYSSLLTWDSCLSMCNLKRLWISWCYLKVGLNLGYMHTHAELLMSLYSAMTLSFKPMVCYWLPAWFIHSFINLELNRVCFALVQLSKPDKDRNVSNREASMKNMHLPYHLVILTHRFP